tara:strand:- start:103216 stop:105060 length:1845 start_codon:yes stop_codon:yes gene_type:complete
MAFVIAYICCTSMPKFDHLEEKIKSVPTKPGVYQYFNKEGVIIYVGKAKNLKRRVSSYFNKNHDYGKVRRLVSQIVDIKYLVVETEMDALLLENNLIKKYQPKYNVMLKDDKSYPWICIKKEPFPRVFGTRRMVKDGSKYFGPYSSIKMMNTLLDLIKELYPLRTCKYNLSPENINAGKFKVCLEYHIGNCLGPCEGKQNVDSYDQEIEDIKKIVQGNIKDVIVHLKNLMTSYAQNFEFEKAQEMKEKTELLSNYQAKSTVVSPTVDDVDVFSLVQDDEIAFVNFLRVKSGSIVQGFTLELKKGVENEEVDDLLKIGIIELRERFHSNSKELILEKELGLGDYFTETVPQRGDKKKLLEMSIRNAKYYMIDKHKQQKLIDPEKHSKRILNTIKTDLRLSELPKHIECFDNSNIQGTNPVAACVVFKNAKPSKKDYRHFNIKTVVGPDDFASMEEVVYRRYKRLLDEEQELPQLIIIDGGKGQLGSAIKSLRALDLMGKIAIVGIAKRLEEIYFPGDSVPLYIDKKSESLKIIQQLRNEAHRFGITFHRQKRSKAALGTELTKIEGIGETTAQKLFKHFGTVKKVKLASEEELMQVLNTKQCKALLHYFSQSTDS